MTTDTTTPDRAAQILRDAGFPEVADFQGFDRPDFRMLHHQARQVAAAEETLARELDYLAGKLERARRDAAAHVLPNVLGVVQGTGLDVDRAAALLGERWSTFQLMASTVTANLERYRME